MALVPGTGPLRMNHLPFRIFFLGQCTAAGYGVGLDASYPQVIWRLLRVRFPGLKFDVQVNPILHPTRMKEQTATCLKQRADVIFLSLPGLYASIPMKVSRLYLQDPEIMSTARAFVRTIQAKLPQDSSLAQLLNKRMALQPTTVLPPLTIEEYERCITETVELCQTTSPCRVVLMGPGGYNHYSEDGNLNSQKLGADVNRMIRETAARMKVPFVDAWELMAEQSVDVYLPATHRWSSAGHEIMAREIEHIIAGQLPMMARMAGMK
ncbi:MAG: SGNH/GDSL hydrolase family protein [Blastocatellia bacterium]